MAVDVRYRCGAVRRTERGGRNRRSAWSGRGLRWTTAVPVLESLGPSRRRRVNVLGGVSGHGAMTASVLPRPATRASPRSPVMCPPASIAMVPEAEAHAGGPGEVPPAPCQMGVGPPLHPPIAGLGPTKREPAQREQRGQRRQGENPAALPRSKSSVHFFRAGLRIRRRCRSQSRDAPWSIMLRGPGNTVESGCPNVVLSGKSPFEPRGELGRRNPSGPDPEP